MTTPDEGSAVPEIPEPEKKRMDPETRRALILEVAKIALPVLLSPNNGADEEGLGYIFEMRGSDCDTNAWQISRAALKIGAVFAHQVDESPELFTPEWEGEDA